MAESVYAVVLCLLGAAARPILTKKYRALLISSQPELKWQSVPPCASYASTGQNRLLLRRMEHVRNTSIIISLDSNDSICPSYSGALETILGKRLTPLETLYTICFPSNKQMVIAGPRGNTKRTLGHITRHFPGVFGSNCLLITCGYMIRWTCIYAYIFVYIYTYLCVNSCVDVSI